MDDLLPVEAVLVSTGFNANDDFFDPAETWAARATPVHKPVNVDHKSADIVGHVVAAAVVGDAPAGAAHPADFGISVRAYLYRHWPQDAAKQAAVAAFLGELVDPGDQAPWCVSMECCLRGFDYALLPAGADPAAAAAATVVPRTPATQFLTKHLRCYGGSGTYAGQRVGRVLRNINFTAFGFTRTPANPKSVVTSVAAAAGGPAPEPAPAAPPVYGLASDRPAPGVSSMPTPEDLKAELAAATAALAAARAELDSAKASQATESLKAKLDEATAAAAAKTAELDTTKAALAAAEAALAAATAAAEAARAETAAAAAEAAFAARVARVRDAYGCDTDEKAAAAAEPLRALSADAFAAHIETMKALRPAKPDAKPTAAAAAAAALAAAAPADAAPVVAVAAAPDASARATALAAELAAYCEAPPKPAPKST